VVHIALVVFGTEHGPLALIWVCSLELGRNWQDVVVRSERIPQDALPEGFPVSKECVAVATVNQVPAFIRDMSDAVGQATIVGGDGEPLVQDRSDADAMAIIVPSGEKAYEGKLVSIANMGATAEAMLASNTSPRLGDGGGAHDVGRLRGEVEKDLTDDVIIVDRILSRWRGRSAAMASEAAHVTGVL
jgi:hypothetical protein